MNNKFLGEIKVDAGQRANPMLRMVGNLLGSILLVLVILIKSAVGLFLWNNLLIDRFGEITFNHAFAIMALASIATVRLPTKNHIENMIIMVVTMICIVSTAYILNFF